MIVLGLILCIVALAVHVPVLWPIGLLLLIVGVVLAALGAAGRVGGRWY